MMFDQYQTNQGEATDLDLIKNVYQMSGTASEQSRLLDSDWLRV